MENAELLESLWSLLHLWSLLLLWENVRACPESLEGMRVELRGAKVSLTGEDRKPAQSLSKGTHLNPFTLTPLKGRSSTRSP